MGLRAKLKRLRKQENNNLNKSVQIETEKVLSGQVADDGKEKDPYKLGVSAKTVQRVEKIADKLVRGTVGKVLTRMDLDHQVDFANRLLRTTGIVKFRANFLKDFPDDIADWKKKGLSEEEIFQYYWLNEKFREFWAVKLGLSEPYLRYMVSESKEPYVGDDNNGGV